VIVVIDMEFVGLPWDEDPDLLWVGLADEQGRSFSAVNADITVDQLTDWSRHNVWPRISDDEPRLMRPELAERVREWVGEHVDGWWAWMPTREQVAALGAPGSADEWWRRTADWDLQLLRRLVDPWPVGWASRCQDIQALARGSEISVPANPAAHHPAADARWGLAVLRLAEDTGKG